MSLRGIVITEGLVGQNVGGDSRQFGLIANGVAVTDKVQLDTAYLLRRPSDAVAIGIDAAYDTAQSVNVYRHITEFYRRAGEGKKLWIMLLAQSVLPAAMTTKAKELAVAADGMISDMAFAFNPVTITGEGAYTETALNGMNADVYAGIAALQEFAEWTDDNDMPLHTILECRGIVDSVATLTDMRALTAQKVTLVIGQDYNYANTLWTLGKKFADVGTFLGVIAGAAWNRNPGEVQTNNLTNAARGSWLVGGLSNHTAYAAYYSEIETLNDKGYVFGIRYQGLTGYWWNDGHVCAPVTIDTDGNINQHTLYYSHTMDQCKRALRIAYLPEVKKPVVLDGGLLPASMVDYYNAVGDAVFERLSGLQLISEGRTYTDPASDLITDKILTISFVVVPTGCVNEIVGTINLKNQ
jgi:hypothetical protein